MAVSVLELMFGCLSRAGVLVRPQEEMLVMILEAGGPRTVAVS